MSGAPVADELCAIAHRFAARGWCLGGGGNFSARRDAESVLITISGVDKARLTSSDLTVCDLFGASRDPALRPSAEAPLHAAVYRHDESIGAVLHTHSLEATLMSRALNHNLRIQGFEMQKSLQGVTTHETPVILPVLDNDQDMDVLSGRVIERLSPETTPGVLIRGHGLYAWGRSVRDAKRHLEGLEFLVACSWQEHCAGRV